MWILSKIVMLVGLVFYNTLFVSSFQVNNNNVFGSSYYMKRKGLQYYFQQNDRRITKLIENVDVGGTKLFSSTQSTSSESNNNNNNNNRIEKCSIQLYDKQTGCEIILLGCFHGSISSSADVEYALTSSSSLSSSNINNNNAVTNVVVLELCTERFNDLRKDYINQLQQQHQQNGEVVDKEYILLASTQEDDDDTTAGTTTTTTTMTPTTTRNTISSNKISWIERYMNMVYTTYRQKGIATGTAIAILGGINGLQISLSGLQPGLEFTTAYRIATSASTSTALSATSTATSTSTLTSDSTVLQQQQQQPNTQQQQQMEIVLADQNVDITIYKLGQLPKVSIELWTDFFQKLFSKNANNNNNDNNNNTKWLTSTLFYIQATALNNALFGTGNTDSTSSSSSSSNNQNDIKLVNFASFLTRNVDAVKDLIRLTIPPLLLIQCISLVLTDITERILLYIHQVITTGSLSGVSTSNILNQLLTFDTTTTSVSSIITETTNTGTTESDMIMSIVLFVGNIFFLLFLYLSIALPATKIILYERDDQLTNGILSACTIATKSVTTGSTQTQQSSGTTGSTGRVVAVLGLLHVNGIAQRIIQSNNNFDMKQIILNNNNNTVI